jgi:hypothetical protein
MTKITNTQIRSLIQDLRDYASSYITREYYEDRVVNEGKKLNKRSIEVKNYTYCNFCSKIDTDLLCQLDYWDELLRLIHTRIVSKNKNKTQQSYCTSYTTHRYLNTGLPIVVYPSWSKNMISNVSLFLFLASGIIQLIRVNIDGGLSFWAQVVYGIGCLLSVLYFAVIGNIEFILPQAGGLIVVLVTLYGILSHFEEPWASL